MDPFPCGGDFGDSREESGAGGIDVAVVNIEREVDVFPVIGGAEEGRSGKRGEDR